MEGDVALRACVRRTKSVVTFNRNCVIEFECELRVWGSSFRGV